MGSKSFRRGLRTAASLHEAALPAAQDGHRSTKAELASPRNSKSSKWRTFPPVWRQMRCREFPAAASMAVRKLVNKGTLYAANLAKSASCTYEAKKA